MRLKSVLASIPISLLGLVLVIAFSCPTAAQSTDKKQTVIVLMQTSAPRQKPSIHKSMIGVTWVDVVVAIRSFECIPKPLQQGP